MRKAQHITNTCVNCQKNVLNVFSLHHMQGKYIRAGAGVCEPASSLKFPLLLERMLFSAIAKFSHQSVGEEKIVALNVPMKSKMCEEEMDGCTFCAPYYYASGIWVRVRGWSYLSLHPFLFYLLHKILKFAQKKVVNLEDLINLFFDYNIKHIHFILSSGKEGFLFFLSFFRLAVNFDAADGVIHDDHLRDDIILFFDIYFLSLCLKTCDRCISLTLNCIFFSLPLSALLSHLPGCDNFY